MRFTTIVSLALLTAGAVAQNNVFGNQNNNNNNNNDNNQNNQNNDNNNQNNQNNDQNNNNNNDQNNNDQNQAGDAALQLDPANVQEGSNADGQAEGAEEGQAASLTDPANFINFCTGKTLTNGVQEEGGSCNGIPMGDIPSTGNMVSSIIVEPTPGQDLPDNNEDITFTVQVQGLVAGSFTNPDNTYYSAPQQLEGGQIVGHTHVTVQDLGNSLTPANPPDPQTFAFFKGINDPGNGNGLLTAVAPGGLPAGFYRVCTMTSASNHQPVLMPVAQRGAQDDCTKFTVGQPQLAGNDQADQDQNNNNNNQDNANQDNANQDNANQDNANQDNANQDNANQDNANQDNANQDNANQDNANQDNANQDNANQDNANQDNANQDQANQDQANQDQQNQNQNNQNGNNQNGGFGNGGFGGFGNRFGRNRFGRNRRFAAREFVA